MVSLLLCILMCSTFVRVQAVNKTDPRVFLAQIEHMFTSDTFINLLETDDEEYRMYNTSEYMRSTRRSMANPNKNFRRIYYTWTSDSQFTMCYIIQTIYRGANNDYRRYYELRQLYAPVYEYAVGYMVFDIIHRYENLLEIYHAVKKWFGDQPTTNHYPISIMLYFYTTMLKQGKVITHLCNMLREIKPKYVEQSIFDDITTESSRKKKKKKGSDPSEADEAMDAAVAVQAELNRMKKQQAKLKKKLRAQQLNLFFKPTPPSRLQKKGPYELHYGWSIEDWV